MQRRLMPSLPVFNTNNRPWNLRSPVLEDRDCGDGKLSDNPELVQDLVLQLDEHNIAMRLDGIHSRVLKEHASVIAGPLFIVSQCSWESGEVPVHWKLANVPISRIKRKKGLSVSFQCLIKLWRRLFWDLLKNIWMTMQSFVTASMGSWVESPAWLAYFVSTRLPT